MHQKIIQEKQNPLLNRKEVVLEVESNIVPSSAEAEKIISEKFSVQPEAFKIKKIIGSFGSKKFKVHANIYPSKKEKNSIEFKSKKEKEAEKKAIQQEIELKEREAEKKALEEKMAKQKEEKDKVEKEKPAEEPKEEGAE